MIALVNDAPVRMNDMAVYAALIAALVVCINLWIVKVARRLASKRPPLLTRWFGHP